MCRFRAFIPVETHKAFIFWTSIISLFIKRLVKKRKTLILWWDLQEASNGLIATQLGPLAVDGPRRLNASNHLSDLIREGMNRAVLINADLNGWTPCPLLFTTPPLSPVSLAPTPPRRRWPAGILLHINGLQSANGWLADRKKEDCQLSNLLCRNEGRNLNTQLPCLDPNSQKHQETRENCADAPARQQFAHSGLREFPFTGSDHYFFYQYNVLKKTEVTAPACSSYGHN